MAAVTEPTTAVDSSSQDVNHKEAFSDSPMVTSVAVKPSSKSETYVNGDSLVANKKTEEEGSQVEEGESKKKFVEAPIPKINPWTVRRQVPAAGMLKGNAPKNLSGEFCHMCCSVLKCYEVNTSVFCSSCGLLTLVKPFTLHFISNIYFDVNVLVSYFR